MHSYSSLPHRIVDDPCSPERNELAAKHKLIAIGKAKTLAIALGIAQGASRRQSPKTAAAPALDPNAMGVSRFIADTGCGYNLVGRDKVRKARGDDLVQTLDHGVPLLTAGGDVLCKRHVDIQCDVFPEGEFNALVLDKTPNVISIGQRCREMGYSFHWPSYSSDPYFLTPEGHHLTLVVHGNIPYLENIRRGTSPAAPVEAGNGEVPGEDASRASAPADDAAPETVANTEPLVGDGGDWLQPFEPPMDPAFDKERDWVEIPDADEDTDSALEEGEPSGEMTTKAQAQKAEAMSVNHLLHHMPKNPWCRTCRLAKAQRRSARRVKQYRLSERRTPTKFGGTGTCDHWHATNDVSAGIAGEQYGLTYKDLATGWIDCFPTETKDALDTLRALRSIPSPSEKLTYFYTDNAPELASAVDSLGATHDTSIPGDSTSNTVIERTNLTVLEGTRAVLFHAGMPYMLWPYAVL